MDPRNFENRSTPTVIAVYQTPDIKVFMHVIIPECINMNGTASLGSVMS